MTRVCIIESPQHPAPGVIGRSLPLPDTFNIQTLAIAPDDLRSVDVLILNSLPSTYDCFPEDALLQFVHRGGGVFSIHDSVFPYSPDRRRFIAACGVRAAYDAVRVAHTSEGIATDILLARADPNDPLQ